MSPFYQKNKLIVNISAGITILVIISIISIVFLKGDRGLVSDKNQKNIDPSINNDRQISQNNKSGNSQPQANKPVSARENSTDPIEKGKALSGDNCSGTGSKKLGSAPMRIEQMSVIIPYGLLAGGHVTPIDHQYYWGKIQMGEQDMYDVLSPGNGKLVNLEYRDKRNEGKKIKGDYRGVIMYSCTFFSYFDLATSLSPDIQSQLPKGWEEKGNLNTNIELKEGQVIGKVGGQSLDFAMWDTTKFLKNFISPIAYNNAEPWKINTVPPLDYYTEEVKQKILPLYANQSLKLDGTIDQDIDGKAAGGWFLEGTNGYTSVFQHGTSETRPYSYGHFALAHDYVDPLGWVFSIGDIDGAPQQFGIKTNPITPDLLGTNSGVVKYELTQWSHRDEKNQVWMGQAPAKSIKMDTVQVKGTALVQMLGDRKIKVEVFMNKTPVQISGFTSAAKTYDRGENAKLVTSNTATN